MYFEPSHYVIFEEPVFHVATFVTGITKHNNLSKYYYLALFFFLSSGVLLSLIVLAVAFQLSEINSPEVTYSEDVNNTCSSYR